MPTHRKSWEKSTSFSFSLSNKFIFLADEPRGDVKCLQHSENETKMNIDVKKFQNWNVGALLFFSFFLSLKAWKFSLQLIISEFLYRVTIVIKAAKKKSIADVDVVT
jgi:hypothetical protein